MADQATIDRVKKIIFDQVRPYSHHLTEASQINDDDSLTDDLGCDSLDVIEICMAVEESFEKEIEDSDWDKLRTVIQISNHVETLK